MRHAWRMLLLACPILKRISSGYVLSWYDWGEWTIEDGLVQTERRTWGHAAPIPLAEFIARIKEVRSKQEKP
jgi:hypothetical protein